MKMVRRPAALSGASSRPSTIAAVPITPPVERNTPRIPVTTAVRSGSRSRMALFEDGAARPIPMPDRVRIAAVSGKAPICRLPTGSSLQPWLSSSSVATTRAIPTSIGAR